MITEKTLELQVKECIIERLELDVSPEDIIDSEPLFGEGLGLDSLDSLELIIAIGKEFDVTIGEGDYEILDTINSITEFIQLKRLD